MRYALRAMTEQQVLRIVHGRPIYPFRRALHRLASKGVRGGEGAAPAVQAERGPGPLAGRSPPPSSQTRRLRSFLSLGESGAGLSNRYMAPHACPTLESAPDPLCGCFVLRITMTVGYRSSNQSVQAITHDGWNDHEDDERDQQLEWREVGHERNVSPRVDPSANVELRRLQIALVGIWAPGGVPRGAPTTSRGRATPPGVAARPREWCRDRVRGTPRSRREAGRTDAS